MARSIDLPAPEFERLFHLTLVRGEVADAGQTPDGRLRICVYASGGFEGPGLRGSLMEGSGDWSMELPDGKRRIDAKYVLKTDDGQVISIDAQGIATPLPDSSWLADAQASAPATAFATRERLFFTVGGKKYGWLGDVVALAIGRVDASGNVCLDAYAL